MPVRKKPEKPVDVEHAKLVPNAEFDHPDEVVADGTLTREEKAKVLRQWEVDEQALSRAGDEGMTQGEGHRLGQVQQARREVLPEKPATKDRRTAGKPAG